MDSTFNEYMEKFLIGLKTEHETFKQQLDALQKCINHPLFCFIDGPDQNDIIEQRDCLLMYLDALARRITRLDDNFVTTHR